MISEKYIPQKYCMHGIIGESNIWRFALKMQLARFLFGNFKYCMEETHTYSLNGVHLIWQNPPPNVPRIQ